MPVIVCLSNVPILAIQKLKLLKNYFTLSMSQEKMNRQVILCIKKYMIEHIDVDIIICNFAFKNTHRNNFVCIFMLN
jgi:hypothetical protein